MYKVIIQTTSNPPPIKSPIFTTTTLKPPQSPISPLLCTSTSATSENPSPMQTLTGTLHLLRNLSLAPHEPSSRMKSRALLILNNRSKIVQGLVEERLMEVEYFFGVEERVRMSREEGKEEGKGGKEGKEKEEGKEIGVNWHSIVVFKSIALAEEFYWFIQEKIGELMSFYVQSVGVVAVEELGGLVEWENVLRNDKMDQDIWIQIPHCQKCLQILQSQITGLPQKPLSSPTHKPPNPPACLVCHTRSTKSPKCSECAQPDDNWVCMVCGLVGCGRYKNADAYKHYTLSKHILSLDLNSNRIWNYKLDCFSHRVVGRDGEIGDGEAGDGRDGGEVDDEQVQAEFWKYCNVVSQQLDRQRNFYNRIKDQQIQRYTSEQHQLTAKLFKLQQQKQLKKQSLKKSQKKQKKLQKRQLELQQQCRHERELNKMYEESVRDRGRYQGGQRRGEMIARRREELGRIQGEICRMMEMLGQE